MAFRVFRHSALQRVLPVLREYRGVDATSPRRPHTGGGDECGTPDIAFRLAPQTQAPRPTAHAKAISSKELRGVLRAVQATEGQRLSADVTSKLLRLQDCLPHARATDFEVRVLGCIFREVIDRRLIVDALFYTCMLRSVAVMSPRLGMSRKALAATLESLLVAAAVTFRHNPIPVLGGILPLYINACLGLQIHGSLAHARAALSSVRLPPVNELQRRELFAEALEQFAMSLFHLAEKWNKVAVRHTTVRVITRAGRRRTRGVKVSDYHYRVLSNIQTIFDELEEKTNSIKDQLEGRVPDDAEEVNGAFFSYRGPAALPPQIDSCEPVDAESEPLLLPRFRCLFRRMPRMPPVDDDVDMQE